MMNHRLSRTSAVPLYQQLKEHLLHTINDGTLAAHTQLPSERALVRELAVSRITVRQALSELVHQGYLYTTPGKGVFVADRRTTYPFNGLLSFTASAHARGLVPSSRTLHAHMLPATQALAHQLSVMPGAEIVSLQRVRLINEVPVMVQQCWLPHARCPGLLTMDLEQRSLYAVLQNEYGLILARSDMVIGARLADGQEQAWLKAADHQIVLTVDQHTFTQDQRPLELSCSVIHGQRYPLNIEQGRDRER